MNRLVTWKVILIIIFQIRVLSTQYVFTDPSLEENYYQPKDNNLVYVLVENNDRTKVRTTNDLNNGMPVRAMLREKSKHKNKHERHMIETDRMIYEQHKSKLKYVREYLLGHNMCAKYVMQEVNRIRRTKVIKDELRKMVRILDKPRFQKVKDEVLQCFQKYKTELKRPIGNLSYKTNHLIQHILQDSNNDGVRK